MTASLSQSSQSKPGRYNGAVCPSCKRQFTTGENVLCPADGMLLVPAVIDPLIGTIIDQKYRLLTLSGQGATGRVYKAWHESIGRTVAIKVANAPTDTASFKVIERMKREARALSVVSHPNIPRLFDGGEMADGSTYLVLDFIEGLSLLEHIDLKGFLHADMLVPMINQVCDALDHIHAHGFVHRDIKPENIIILNKPQGRINVKLIDFGICKLNESALEEAAAAVSAKSTVELAGSPLYMSPEHVTPSLIDKRSDIYSLGATIYHALSGRPPMSETTLIDIVHAHKSVMPAPLSVVRPEADVSPALEAVIFRALQKFPANRYQSAGEMKAALARAFSGDTYTGKLVQLQFSGAELRALTAFVMAAGVERVQRLLGQEGDLTARIQTSLLEKLKEAVKQFDGKTAPTGESLEELSLERTYVGPAPEE